MNNKLKTLKFIGELIKYALVGCTNVIIDILILNILSYTTGITSGKTLFVFNIIAFLVYSISGYMLNENFTFKGIARPKAYFQYASILFFSMIFNSLLLVVLTSYNPLIALIPNEPNIVRLNHLWLSLVILTNSAVIGLLGFLINKFFVFNKKKTC
ncbi:MAG: GtrA family protein [Clostridium sp.]